MKTYLLFTKNFSKSLEEIKKVGGHVTQKFTKSVFVANFPDSMKISKLVKSSTKPYAKLDGISTLMVKAWKLFQSNKDKQPKIKKKNSAIQNALINDSVSNFGNLNSNPPAGVLAPTSEKMTGKIALGLILVSNPNYPIYTFSQTELNQIGRAIIGSCQFLATVGGTLANITFQYDVRVINITATPNPSCNNRESCEAVFRDAALKQMGYKPNLQGVTDYVTGLRTKLNTDWAYMAFVTKYPMVGSAYAGYNRICAQYPNFLSPTNTSPSFTQLSCNIFGAANESPGSGCDCDYYGKNMIQNHNCANCQGVQKVPCLMSNPAITSLCPWTMGQLGWINPRYSGSTVAKMSQYLNRYQIVYNDQDNQISQISWANNTGDWAYNNLSLQVPQAPKTIGIPMVAQYGNSLYVFYQDQNNQISAVYYSAGSWRYINLNTKLPQAASVNGYLSSSITNDLNFVYKDINNHVSHIWYDGGVPSYFYEDLNTSMPNASQAKSNPSIVKYGINWQVYYADVNNHIAQMVFQSNKWRYTDLHALIPQAPDVNSIYSEVSITQYGNTIQIVYTDVNMHVSQMTWNGSQWIYNDLSTLLTQAYAIEDSPNMTQLVFNNSLHIVYRDIQNHISHMYFDGAKWNYEKIYTAVTSTRPPLDSPTITTYNNQIQVLTGLPFAGSTLLYWDGSSWSIKEISV